MGLELTTPGLWVQRSTNWAMGEIYNIMEYVFLSAGKFMPGMEKLAGELFFPTNQQLFLTTEGSKNSWF